MTMQHDSKGKYFTDVVTKDVYPAIIQTDTYRVLGNVHVHVNHRMKDELNLSEQFLAVTDCIVVDQLEKVVFRSSFIAINRDRIVWVIPESDLISDSTGEGLAP